ncbi:hypothetical protein OC845_000578 [Tilletia horrida]|nr:hypothetical protein OC845_000578 [Tilletia horrida]
MSKASIREMKARQRDLETFGDDALALLGPNTLKQQQQHQSAASRSPVKAAKLPQQQQHQHHSDDASAAKSRKRKSATAANAHSSQQSSPQQPATPIKNNKHNNNNSNHGNHSNPYTHAMGVANTSTPQQTPVSASPSSRIPIPGAGHQNYHNGAAGISSTASSGSSSHSINGLAYAGPRFHNSPSPADLPAPKFGSKRLGGGSGPFSSSPSAPSALNSSSWPPQGSHA